MTVKTLIEMLNKCNPEFPVQVNHSQISYIMQWSKQHKKITADKIGLLNEVKIEPSNEDFVEIVI